MTTTPDPIRTARILNANVQLQVLACWKCGTIFAVESVMHRKLNETGDTFYCPNGDRIAYGTTRVHELEQQLQHVRRLQQDTEQRRQTTKAALTRLTNRIAFGVCPCCHRHFDDLQRHMATQHPDFKKSQDGIGEAPDYTSLEKLLAERPGELMSVREAATFKNTTDQAVYYAIRRRKLPAVMLRGAFRLSREDVERWKLRSSAIRARV